MPLEYASACVRFTAPPPLKMNDEAQDAAALDDATTVSLLPCTVEQTPDGNMMVAFSTPPCAHVGVAHVELALNGQSFVPLSMASPLCFAGVRAVLILSLILS